MYFLNKICLNCGKSFITSNKRKKYCCKKCNEQYQNKKRKKKTYNKTCVICGKDFIAYRKDKICCSSVCRAKRYKQDKSSELKEKRLKQYSLNKEKLLEKSKKWKQNNKEKIKKYQKEWNEKNKKHVENYRKEYYANNKEKLLCKEREKFKHNINYRIVKILRNQLRYNINNKTFHTFKILDYTSEDLKNHLELLFTEGMNWENYGGINGWHIDHIRPIASFNFINEDGSQNLEEIKKCWALENLQPLWAKDNKSKGAWYNNKCYRKKG